MNHTLYTEEKNIQFFKLSSCNQFILAKFK